MFKGLAGMASMMGNLQHLPKKLEGVNEQLRGERVVGKAAEGLVVVEMNGLGELQAITIDPSLIVEGNPEPAQQPICEATNEASSQAKQMYGQAIHRMAQEMNLNIPGIDSLLTRLTGS